MVRSGPFWDHVTEIKDGLSCKFCNHIFAPGTSISRIKSHLSGVRGGGARICTGVPDDVKKATCLASHNNNKRPKTMASSSQNELRNTGSTFSTEQANGTEIPIPTVDVESMRTEVMSMEGMETTDFPLVEAADPVENMSLEYMQPVGTSSSHERLLVDAPNIREDAFPTTYLASLEAHQNWQQIYPSSMNDDLPGNSGDISQSLGVTPFPDFEEFESRASVSNQIVAALKDPNVNKVGVYGMGGTGKTTLAEKIGADLQLNGTFSYVVLATVSEKQSLLQNNYQSDLTSIQKQIAGGLKIQLQGENLRDRAAELREQLQKRDKVLIILDNIWSRFELRDVGIPVGSGVHKKFKILMTSRNRMVLQNEMDSTNNFGLDSLPFDDAWNLFDRMVGGAIEYSNWRPTAEQVVKECGGIPILLATTARALRNKKDQDTWEDALTQLKQFDGCDFDEDAYKSIEVSYKFLKNEETKKLFLLCAQLDHRSIPMEDLLKYTKGLDLFKERKKLIEVRRRLRKYLGDLKGCCLLQDGNEEGIIKMHDVVHKFASVVAFKDHHVFSVANDGELEEWPSKDQFEKFTAISFFHCRLPSDHMLPVALDNPKLESFLMLRSEIHASFKIPDNFFAGMKGLKLMNLTRMSLSRALVSSLCALVKIRTLCLDYCELDDIAVIGELPMLQALSLIGSSIVCVPKEIGKLGSTLKLLDLRDCWRLETIASGVISRLTLLEDLRIPKSFTRWEQLQRRSSNNISADETYEAEMASLEEFKNLRNLINLEIHIREHAKMFPKDLVFKKLETFRISIRSCYVFEAHYILPRTLEVSESSTVVEFDNEGTKALMTRAQSLWLREVRSSVSVSEMDPKGFPELKHLKVFNISTFSPIENCEIQYIVKKNYNNFIFPKLETLDLFQMYNLKRICDDYDHPLPVGSFENLTVIKVCFCMLLNDLLSSNLARGLLRLKEISVISCSSMESIIVSRESENEEEIKIGFSHQLRVLELGNLPHLLSFCSFKQLEGVPIPSPTTLFNKKTVFSKLEVLNLRSMKIEKIWDDHLAIAAEGIFWLQNLTCLNVYACDNLSYLFTSSMVKSLAKLKQLRVDNCESIEEIVASTEREMAGEIQLSFPKLDWLELVNLPKLKSFCHAKLLECQLLRELLIQRCFELKTFISTNDSSSDNSTTLFSEKVAFPNMEKLSIDGASNFKMICGNQLHPNSFSKLKILEINGVRDLLNAFTPSIWRRALDLEKLEIVGCESLEKVFDVQILPMNERETCRILSFQNLRLVCVSYCPTLTSIFPTSLVPTFQQLERLEVRNCDSLEKVFDVQILPMNERETCRILPFQNLRSVSVSDCPTLTSIFPTSLVPTLQQLERLVVRNCDEIDLFAFNNTQQLNDAFAKVISSLKYYYLESGGIIVKYEHQKFKLNIVGCGFQVSPVLFALLKSFPKLDKVVVSSCSIIQLFPCEPGHLAAGDGDDTDTQAKTFALIQHLKLTKLSNMKHILSEHPPLKYHGIPRDLKVLEVVHCDSLLSLAPPSTTLFKNLTGLVVSRCPMLIKLIASSSTAKSLVNLKKMSVRKCDSLKEIVVIDDQCDELASNDEDIVFEKLEVLNLRCLKSLTSFCSTSKCNFQFLSLNRVFVTECPKMKFFSEGTLSTPKLKRVEDHWLRYIHEWDEDDSDEDEWHEDDQGRWKDDLNSTIRQLFEERTRTKNEDEDEDEDEDEYGDEDEDEDEDDDGDEDENEDEEV